MTAEMLDCTLTALLHNQMVSFYSWANGSQGRKEFCGQYMDWDESNGVYIEPQQYLKQKPHNAHQTDAYSWNRTAFPCVASYDNSSLVVDSIDAQMLVDTKP